MTTFAQRVGGTNGLILPNKKDFVKGLGGIEVPDEDTRTPLQHFGSIMSKSPGNADKWVKAMAAAARAAEAGAKALGASPQVVEGCHRTADLFLLTRMGLGVVVNAPRAIGGLEENFSDVATQFSDHHSLHAVNIKVGGQIVQVNGLSTADAVQVGFWESLFKKMAAVAKLINAFCMIVIFGLFSPAALANRYFNIGPRTQAIGDAFMPGMVVRDGVSCVANVAEFGAWAIGKERVESQLTTPFAKEAFRYHYMVAQAKRLFAMLKDFFDVVGGGSACGWWSIPLWMQMVVSLISATVGVIEITALPD